MITEITSYGGELHAGLEMIDTCLEDRGLTMIALVESKAISAAAALICSRPDLHGASCDDW